MRVVINVLLVSYWLARAGRTVPLPKVVVLVIPVVGIVEEHHKQSNLFAIDQLYGCTTPVLGH